ncbi:MAG: Mur ligase family protein [Armatimonadetes bacterium]|nr:Mur ligase family protein [Armatimonadota bacterium]MDW8154088.1 Mur ligase family protein [Armatimonadota bacterium]
MSVRLRLAILLARSAAHVSRGLRWGGGTTLPGRLARRISPGIVEILASQLPRGIVAVSGTNGKTTTARLVAEMAQAAGLRVVHNRAGANLPAGIASALVGAADLRARVQGDVGVFEVDEAAFPLLLPVLRPRVVVLLNLFRDQLDRYGEVEAVARRWRTALQGLPEAIVCFNADDPQVAEVARDLPQATVPFGVEDERCGLETLEDAADVRYCYRCGAPYTYQVVYLSHAGRYRCERCGVRRPDPAVYAEAIHLDGMRGTEASVVWPGGCLRVRIPLPGLYNVYNALAATAAALSLGVSGGALERALKGFRPAFGRAERLRWRGRELEILLAKNPAGLNALLRMVARHPPASLLVAIHDRTADGRDVSWLWDVDFEGLQDSPKRIVASGLRATDLALRLRYAGIPEERLVVEPDLARALHTAAQGVPEGETLLVLPTYTAMLELRRILQREGVAPDFWEA